MYVRFSFYRLMLEKSPRRLQSRCEKAIPFTVSFRSFKLSDLEVVRRRILTNGRRGVLDTHMLLDLCLVDDVAQGLGGVVELGGLGVVETELDDVAHAAAVEHGWGADVDVVEAVFALKKRRDR